MAINPQKLLPQAKLSTGERMAAAYDKKIDGLLNFKIKKKLINVDKLVNTTKKVKEKTKKQKKIRKEGEERKKKEGELEKNQPKGVSKLNLPSLPKTGFLDSIQNFIGYTFLGYLFTNYSNNLPALMGVVKQLPAAMDTFGNIIKGTIDITTGMIEGGYKFRNDLSQKVNELGGKDAQKTFDTFTNNFKDMINSIMTLGLYKPQPQPKPQIPQRANGGYVRKMVPGGKVTKTSVKPITRQIQKIETKKTPSIVYRQISDPGKDITGGREQIEKIFPYSSDVSQPGPLNTLMTTSSTLSKIPFIGPLMGAAVDIAMGQRPDKRIYQIFGDSLASLIAPSIDSQSSSTVNNIVTTIASMASGGPITRGIIRKRSGPEQIGFALAKLFETNVEERLSKIFLEILRTKAVQQEPAPGAGAVKVDSSSPDFWLLAIATLLENSDPQGAADVAQAIYNRVESPSWPNSIRGVIFQPGQFQPVRDYGTPGAWSSIKDKESAINFLKKYGGGRNQTQLEQVSAALLDQNRQRSAANFVGPRDNFRAIAFERANNHLADDTEQRRHGHVFGFEPAGAQIGAFRAGRLKPAKVSSSTTGTVTALSTPLTGENGKLKPSQLTRVGTLYGTVDYQDWYGNGAYLRHEAARAFLAAKAQAEKEGVTILITSAYRSIAHQQALQGIYSVVAPPGTSRHGEGTALDIQTGTRGYDWFVKNGPNYGWQYMAIPNDPVHFEYLGGYRPPTQTKTKSATATSPLKPPASKVASTQPKVMDTANQLAMTPSYAEQGGTTFVLMEKILLKEVQTTSSTSPASNIQFPGVNSTVPTLIG
jgi:hypothetical protein